MYYFYLKKIFKLNILTDLIYFEKTIILFILNIKF